MGTGSGESKGLARLWDTILPVIAGLGGRLPSNGIPPLGPLGWGEAGLTESRAIAHSP